MVMNVVLHVEGGIRHIYTVIWTLVYQKKMISIVHRMTCTLGQNLTVQCTLFGFVGLNQTTVE